MNRMVVVEPTESQISAALKLNDLGPEIHKPVAPDVRLIQNTIGIGFHLPKLSYRPTSTPIIYI